MTALFLFPDQSAARFLCRHCLSLPRPSDLIGSYTYQAAKDPFRPNLSLPVQLRALAVWWRWQTEGKRWKGRESGERWEAVTPTHA